MSWTQLRDNFEDLVSFFSGTKSTLPYPLKKKINDSLINDFNEKNWNKSLSYSFQVVHQRTNKRGKKGEFVSGFQELKLQINPIEITQEENFAINITPTQDGIISEHNGIVFRDLVISGTTGIHPLRGTGGVTKDGKVIGAGRDKQSGYKEFQIIRNYFRAYAIHKKEAGNQDSILVYVNRKDNEVLIIEPLKFTKKRSGARGKLYDYVISSKVIGNFDKTKADDKRNDFFTNLDEVIEDVGDFLDTARGILLRSEELLRQTEREIDTTLFEPLRKFDLFVKTVGGTKTTVGDMSENLVTRFNSSLTLKFLGLAEDNPPEGTTLPQNPEKVAETQGGVALLALGAFALTQIDGDEEDLTPDLVDDFASEKSDARKLTREFFETLKTEAERIRDNAADAFGVGNSVYDNYANRQQTFVPSPTKQTTNEEQEILFGFAQLCQALNLTLAYGNSEFQKNIEDDFQEAENNFNNTIDLPVPSSVNEIIIAAGQSLEDIAFVQLGDINRWIEIAKLNNLKPPYIADVSTDSRVKQPGDRILLPSDGVQIDTNVIIVKENKFNADLTETEKRLGIDFKLNDDFDFVFTNAGDFELIRAGANAGQAIRIKFNLEKGDLKYHPDLGLGLIIGSKNVDIDLLFDDLVGTILQDPRFSDVNNFDLRFKEGNTIVVNLSLLVAESDTPTPLEINL